jgi:hypothetical protein
MRVCSASTHVIKESLKWKVKDCEAVEALHTAVPQLLEISQALQVSIFRVAIKCFPVSVDTLFCSTAPSRLQVMVCTLCFTAAAGDLAGTAGGALLCCNKLRSLGFVVAHALHASPLSCSWKFLSLCRVHSISCIEVLWDPPALQQQYAFPRFSRLVMLCTPGGSCSWTRVSRLGAFYGYCSFTSPEQENWLIREPSLTLRHWLIRAAFGSPMQGLGGVVNEQSVPEETRIAVGRCIRQLKHLWKAGGLHALAAFVCLVSMP